MKIKVILALNYHSPYQCTLLYCFSRMSRPIPDLQQTALWPQCLSLHSNKEINSQAKGHYRFWLGNFHGSVFTYCPKVFPPTKGLQAVPVMKWKTYIVFLLLEVRTLVLYKTSVTKCHGRSLVFSGMVFLWCCSSFHYLQTCLIMLCSMAIFECFHYIPLSPFLFLTGRTELTSGVSKIKHPRFRCVLYIQGLRLERTICITPIWNDWASVIS